MQISTKMFGGAQPPLMQKTTIKTVLQNFVVFPILATNFLFSPFGATGSSPLALLIPDTNKAPVSAETVNLQKIQQEQAKKIDAYFEQHDMPLLGYGMKMVQEAYKNDIDPYLIAAVAVRESSGGIHACSYHKENFAGWDSCKSGLGGTYDSAIELLSQHLGGNNDKTSHYYKDKTTVQILKTYNPDSIIPGYSSQVMRIMDTMATIDVTPEVAMNS